MGKRVSGTLMNSVFVLLKKGVMFFMSSFFRPLKSRYMKLTWPFDFSWIWVTSSKANCVLPVPELPATAIWLLLYIFESLNPIWIGSLDSIIVPISSFMSSEKYDFSICCWLLGTLPNATFKPFSGNVPFSIYSIRKSKKV